MLDFFEVKSYVGMFYVEKFSVEKVNLVLLVLSQKTNSKRQLYDLIRFFFCDVKGNDGEKKGN